MLEKIKANGAKDLGVISKFNESSQVKMLEDQNQDLEIELKTFQSYLRTYENQKTGLVPMQYEIQKMNANHVKMVFTLINILVNVCILQRVKNSRLISMLKIKFIIMEILKM